MKKFKKQTQLNLFEQVYEIIKRIPQGKVLTYGMISKLINQRMSAAAVGWALNALANNKKSKEYTLNTVPWYRVVNAKGTLSTKLESNTLDTHGQSIKLQQILLENEGIVFDNQTIDLSRYSWKIRANKPDSLWE